ncbi:hypothetical protein NK356_02275 [Chryseobacterium sp. S0630]|uniref:TPR end-of-group domain-containing protein n=1 Tax=Chryseobacterium sp. S0630 TaxID=2957803 RepID=UPI00209D367A|nr:hypothetical protein [Chryseobacterium sp. S0630]MCP1298001.1 hypothetical protein [Chryseobacterium sp. S0630]
MRNTIYTLLLLFLFVNVNAQEYSKLINEANKLYESKDYKMSADLYDKAFKIESENPSHLYNGACSSSLAGNTKQAFQWLNLSIEKGWTNLKHLNSDTDLENLHSKDPDNVDKRRTEVGLDPISNYIKNWDLVWDVEKYKRELPELEKLNK